MEETTDVAGLGFDVLYYLPMKDRDDNRWVPGYTRDVFLTPCWMRRWLQSNGRNSRCSWSGFLPMKGQDDNRWVPGYTREVFLSPWWMRRWLRSNGSTNRCSWVSR
ncbi:uncharacterized protein [Asterias amurensis]|uniref:uncharacterized protein n=1 Tax=Asterias amurensis TaxID=7602 RepID=UPI003AB87CD6